MKWHKIVLINEQLVHGILDEILIDLSKMEDSFALPKGFAVFAGYETEDGLPIYFTLDTSQYISELMFSYGGSPCEKPEDDKIGSLLHCPCADSEYCWSLLKI